jgi:DNA topoisomerase VI subunit A
VGILSLYKNGSRRMPESARHRLPTLRWLGARAGMLRAASGADFQPLTPRDRALVTSLGAALRGPDPAWAAELEAMEAAGAKAEMEAAYSGCGGAAGFGAAVAEMARRGDWV